MKKAYSYVRFSHPRQAEGDSQRRQIEQAQRWCEHNGYTLDESLKMLDFGVSAFRGVNRTRGALAAFLRAIKERRISPGSALIVESLDRLSREEVDEALQQFLNIVRAGVVVVTLYPAEMKYDRATISANASALMMALMVMGRAHEESATKARRVAEAWETKRRRAKTEPLTAKCPGWLRLNRETNRFEIVAERAAIVRRMVKLAIGGLGAVGIAVIFNRERVPTLTVRRNKPAVNWEFSTIQYLLRSKTLIGEYQPKRFIDKTDGDGNKLRRLVAEGEPICGYYPRVISERDFWRLQAVLDTRKKGVRGRTGRNVANLFGRVLVSGANGSTMRLAQKRADAINLVSAAAVRGLAVYESFPYREFEAAFLQWVRELTWEKETSGDDRTMEIQGRLGSIKTKIERVKVAIGDAAGSDGLDELLDMLRRLGIDEKRLQAELHGERAKRASPNGADAQREVVSLAARLDALSGAELREARERLRSQIQGVCPVIRMWVWGTTVERFSVCDVTLADGRHRLFAVVKRRGLPAVSAGASLPVSRARWNFEQVARKAIDLLALATHEGKRDPTPFDKRTVKVFVAGSAALATRHR